jgi:hypothetical protein
MSGKGIWEPIEPDPFPFAPMALLVVAFALGLFAYFFFYPLYNRSELENGLTLVEFAERAQGIDNETRSQVVFFNAGSQVTAGQINGKLHLTGEVEFHCCGGDSICSGDAPQVKVSDDAKTVSSAQNSLAAAAISKLGGSKILVCLGNQDKVTENAGECENAARNCSLGSPKCAC